MALGRLTLLLAALALINEGLASRGVPMLLYGFVNVLCGAAGVYAVLAGTVFTPASEGYAVFFAMLILLSIVHCAVCAVRQPDSNQFIWLSDMLIIGLLLLLSSTHLLARELNTGAVGFSLSALLSSLIMTSHLRSGGESDHVVRGSGIGGWLVLGGMLAVCLALTAGLVVLGGGQVDGIVALAVRLWHLLGSLFERLIKLLAAVLSLNLGKHIVLERQTGHYTVTIIPLDDQQAAGTAPAWIVYGFLALLGLVLLAVIIGFLLDFRGKRAKRAAVSRRRRVVTRKSHLLSALHALFRSLFEAIAFELALRTGKHTPQGLYVLALRTCRSKAIRKQPSESPGAYMRRLHALMCERQETSSLDRLAAMLDAALYGGETIRLHPQERDAFAAQIRTLSRVTRACGSCTPPLPPKSA